jgi:HK97 family phage major capsid protein
MDSTEFKRLLHREFEVLHESFGEKFASLEERVEELELDGQRPSYAHGRQKSAGALFTGSEAYKNMVGSSAVDCPPVEVKSFNYKALTSDPASAGALVVPQRDPEIVATPRRAFILRDLLRVRPATSNAVEYVEETGFTNNAGVVAEGELKPESGLSFEAKSAAVRTIAHTVTATTQMVADSSQMADLIEGALSYGVGLAEERQILYGDGTGQNLQGIMTHPAVQVHNIADGSSGDTRIDAIRRAITRARLAEYPVTGLVIHPEDWEDIELTKDSNGRYIYIEAPSAGGAGTFWRLAVVDSTAIEPGVALLGAFGLGATIWDRQAATVRISEHHEDYFRRNLVLVRGESRLTLTIGRPQAFVKVEFNPPA